MDLTAWREKQAGELFELPSGLVIRARRVGLLDLAEQGNIPAPLVGLVETLLHRGEVHLTVEEFEGYGEVSMMVARAAIVDPPLTEEPTEVTLGESELGMDDRIAIFNWANGGAKSLRPFRQKSGSDVAAVDD